MPKGYDNYNQGHRVDVDLTVDTDAYTALDVVGGLMTVTKDIHIEWFGCTLRAVTVRDSGAQDAAFKLYVFEQLPSTIADDASWNTAVLADLDKLATGKPEGIDVSAGLYVTHTTGDEGTVSQAGVSNVNLDLDLKSGTPSTFYAYLVCTGTPTFTAADDLRVSFYFWID
jgi:hypothetical protein